MSIPKCLDFSDFNRYPADENPTTDADMQNFMGNQNELMKSIVGALIWQPQTNYSAEQVVYSPNLPPGFNAVCVTGGKTGSVEPAWNSDRTTYPDGSVVWNITSMESGGHKIVNELPNLDDAKENVVYFVENDEEKTPDELNVGQAINDLDNRISVIETGADYVIASGHSADNTQWYRKWKSGWLEQGGIYDADSVYNGELRTRINFIKNYVGDYVINTSGGIRNQETPNTLNMFGFHNKQANGVNIYFFPFNGNQRIEIITWYACGMGANE